MTVLPQPAPVFYASTGETAFRLAQIARAERYWTGRDPLLAEGGPARADAKGEWSYPGYRLERLTLSADQFAPFAGRFAYAPGDEGPMPDFAPWSPLPVVHDDLRRIVMDVDPEGSHFFPARIDDPDGMLRPGPRFYWLARRRLTKLQTQSISESLNNIRRFRRFTAPGVPKEFFNDMRRTVGYQEAVWQMISDQRLRARMRLLPVWGFNVLSSGICISAPLFRRLQEAGITGLAVQTADHPADFVQGEIFVGV